MNIDKAMMETRRYFVLSWSPDAFTVGTRRTDISAPSLNRTFKTRAEAQIACDRMNLLAVLACIREESDAMCAAGAQNHKDAWGPDAPIFEHSVYRAMIAALIAEVEDR